MANSNYRILESINGLAKPHKCPMCHNGIDPTFIIGYEFKSDVNDTQVRLVFACPMKDCLETFFGYYFKNGFDIYDRTSPRLSGCSPFKFKGEDFSDSIHMISKDFVLIYNQAKNAEERKLDQICGIGYRKSLEFLIKDYLIQIHPEKEDEISSNPYLQKVIVEYVTDKKVIEMAKRAIWLGNDHAHYKVKWVDKDINDLKRLINTTVLWLSAEKEYEHYMTEMDKGK